jgi:hypothetical protein
MLCSTCAIDISNFPTSVGEAILRVPFPTPLPRHHLPPSGILTAARMKALPPSPLLSLLTGPSSSPATTLVHVKQTTLQSCAPLLSELVHAALDRSEKVVLLSSGERRQLSFLVTAPPRGVLVVAPNGAAEYEEVGSRTDVYWSEVTRAVAEGE